MGESLCHLVRLDVKYLFYFIELQKQTLLIMLLLPLDGVLLMMVLIIGLLETPGVLLGETVDTSKLRGVLVELVPYALPYLGK